MKYKVYIEPIEELIELNKPVNSIVIENPKLYRNIYFNYESSLLFSIDDKIIQFNSIAVVNNSLDLEINTKKNLSILYKRLEAFSDLNDLDLVGKIEGEIISLIEKLSVNLDVGIDYDDGLDFNKLFSLMKVRFSSIDSIDYLELVINFIKTVCELGKIKVIVFFGLTTNLTKDEYDLLLYELKLLDVKIFDICNFKNDFNDNLLLIDEDYCII